MSSRQRWQTRARWALAAGISRWGIALVLAAGLAIAVALAGGGLVLLLVAVAATSPRPAYGTGQLDVPPVMAAAYREAAMLAARRWPDCGLRWSLLAAIGFVESRHGAGTSPGPDGRLSPPIVGPRLDGSAGTARIPDTDGGTFDGDGAYDRAVGPMQLLPATWRAQAGELEAGPAASPHRPRDAATAAAVYLCRGGTRLTDRNELTAALHRYNHSAVYVQAVLARLTTYERAAAGSMPPLTTHPNLSFSEAAAADLRAGLVDPGLQRLLAQVAADHELTVTVFVTGHGECVGGGDRASRPGCVISAHTHGRAVDISHVDGEPVSPTHTGARRLVEELAALDPAASLGPAEVGSPSTGLDHRSGFFSDAAHGDHIHISVLPRMPSTREMDG